MNFRKFFWLLSLLVIPALACSLTSAAQETAVPPPADGSGPTGPSGDAPADAPASPPVNDDGTPVFMNPQDVSDVQNFRIKIYYLLTDPDGNMIETFDIAVAHTGDPSAEHYVLTGEMDDGEGPQTIEYIRIEDQLWLQFGGMWISTTDDGSMTTLDDFTPEVAGFDEVAWENLGPETVNGVQTIHYRATEQNPAVLQMLNDELTGEEGEIAFESAQVDIYTDARGLIIREVINGQGQRTNADGTTSPVVMQLTYDLMDVNSPDIVISPPEQGQDGGETLIPLPETTVTLLSSPGFAMYNIPDMTLEETLAFLQEQGDLEITSTIGDATSSYLLTVVYQGATYSVTLSPGESGGTDLTLLGGE